MRKLRHREVKELPKGPGAVAHACNPSTLGGQEIKTILTNTVKPVSIKINRKISWAWWRVPVVAAILPAGELLEPGRWRLQ